MLTDCGDRKQAVLLDTLDFCQKSTFCCHVIFFSFDCFAGNSRQLVLPPPSVQPGMLYTSICCSFF